MPRRALTGTRIRDRRVAVGLRQADVARSAGISASYLNLIEHNRRRIAGKVLSDIARALDCDVSALTEGAEDVLLATLREAAASGETVSEAERDRAEEFAGRFPGWAALLAERHARADRLEQEVRALSDRLAHDPLLSASLHEVLTAVTAIRSTASILAGTEDLDPVWSRRFLRNLDADGRRLAEGATALVRYLDGPAAHTDVARTPQEEVEALMAAADWHLPALETPEADTATVEALVDEAPELSTGGGRAMARATLLSYLADARALPLAALGPLADHPPGALAARFGVAPDLVLRRLAHLPGREAGLVVCDAAGAIVYRRPLTGFPLPRHGAGCPLWPLYRALTQPSAPLMAVLAIPGTAPRRVLAQAVAAPVVPVVFGSPPVLRATMLLTPAPGAEGAEVQVGTACRVCPRHDCPARREPSVLGAMT